MQNPNHVLQRVEQFDKSLEALKSKGEAVFTAEANLSNRSGNFTAEMGVPHRKESAHVGEEALRGAEVIELQQPSHDEVEQPRENAA